jgi:hypothetical protein
MSEVKTMKNKNGQKLDEKYSEPSLMDWLFTWVVIYGGVASLILVLQWVFSIKEKDVPLYDNAITEGALRWNMDRDEFDLMCRRMMLRVKGDRQKMYRLFNLVGMATKYLERRDWRNDGK